MQFYIFFYNSLYGKSKHTLTVQPLVRNAAGNQQKEFSTDNKHQIFSR